MGTENQRLAVRVAARRMVAKDICEFTLSHAAGVALPGFEPGAHIAVETPSLAMRRYSLINDGVDPASYVIAVMRVGASRGGSVSMHDSAPVGSVLQVDPPENSFALVPAPKYLLIAGGIGVTPILSMARKLASEGKSFRVVYCARTAEEAAFLEELRALPGTVIHHDEGDRAKVYDFWEHFEEPRNEHVFCCGPAGMMAEIKALSGHWPEGRIHFEDFKPVDVVRPSDSPFRVTLLKSNRMIDVPADRTILEAIRDAGEKTVSSCESGTCGTCKCRLVQGEVDHRDMVLMDEEKADRIMICVSRARSGDLVLDL